MNQEFPSTRLPINMEIATSFALPDGFITETYGSTISDTRLTNRFRGALPQLPVLDLSTEVSDQQEVPSETFRRINDLTSKLDPAKSIRELVETDVFASATALDRQLGSIYLQFSDGSIEHSMRLPYESPEKLPPARAEAPAIKVIYEDTSFDPLSPPRQPDFVITRSGTIKVLNNPEEHPGTEIVIQLERAPGQVNQPDVVQSAVLGALMLYLKTRIQKQFPEALQTGISLDDRQGLVPDAAKHSGAFDSAAPSALPASTQQQVEQMSRFGGSGRGSMSPQEASDLFPSSDVPRLPSESDQIAALKNVVAGFESRDEKEPYCAVQSRAERGWAVGRYAQTAWAIFNWLMGLSEEDLEEIEKLEAVDKNGKPIKKSIPKGTASRLRAALKVLKDGADPVRAKDSEFLDFLKKLNDGKEAPSREEIDRFLPPAMQELIAGDMIHHFAGRSIDGNGKVDIGKVVLAMHLGSFPNREELDRKDNQALMKAAENAYPMALSAVTHPKDDVVWRESNGRIHGEPNDYFFTQFRNPKWNPNGPGRSNNCGPASLAMAMKAFGKAGDGDPQRLIEHSRILMTGRGGNSLTNNGQILRGAREAGLQGHTVAGASSFDSALDEGKMVIALGNPGKSYGNRLSSNQYAKYNGGHYILVVGKEQDQQGKTQYLINDPLSKTGTLAISEREMRSYGSDYRQSGVAVWA